MANRAIKFAAALGLVSGMALSIAVATPAYAQEAKRDFNIRSQPLASALVEFSRQSDLVVTASARLTRGKTARKVQGNYAPRAALEMLLRNTRLQVRTNASGSFMLEEGQSLGNGLLSQPESGEEEGAEIIVTGTNIAGLKNTTSQITTYDRDYIANTGYSTVQDLIRSVPQNFAGGSDGASEDGVFGAGVTARGNREGAVGINLKGLGVGGTLVLLNGQRLAPAAFGSIVNVGMIPLSAIERVDILPDGASAIYGADAVGGVVNFVLRKGYTGAQSGLRYGWADGNIEELTLTQDAGFAWKDGDAILAVQYRERDNLPSSARSFTETVLRPNDLLSDLKQLSVLGNVRQDITSNLRASVTGLFSRSKTNRDLSVTAQSTTSGASEELISLSGGIGYRAFADWNIDLKSSFSTETLIVEQRFSRGAPPEYPGGVLNIRNASKIWGVDVQATGTAFMLGENRVRAALGVSYRDESLKTLQVTPPLRNLVGGTVKAAFGEIFVPVISEGDSVSFARAVDVSIAGRIDSYSDYGDTFNPKFGIRYSPLEGFSIKSSYGTSFRPPNLREAFAFTNQNTAIRLSRQSPSGGTVPVFVLGGTEPLSPERSKNFTVGLEWAPPAVPGLVLSMSYYNIKYRDRIITPPLDATALLKPDVYGSLIETLADDAAATAYAAQQLALGVNVIGSPVGVRYIYSVRQQNAAVVKQSGADFEIRYAFKLSDGEAMARLTGAWIDKILTQLTSESRPADIVNTFANPPALRLRGDLGWRGDNMRLNAALNYVGSYADTTVLPSVRATAYTTIDMSAQFDVVSIGAKLGLTISNLLNRRPPYIANAGRFVTGVHYDAANASALGRMISIELRKSW